MRTLGLVVWLISFSIGMMPLDVQAQDPNEPSKREALDFQDYDDLELEDLLDITITIAAGKVQTLEEAPSIVCVITAEDIRQMGARTLTDVIRIVPGFEVLTDRHGRKIIVARGIKLSGSSENVLVLFNGHRLNEEFNGGATLINPDLPVDNIKQVEIIRGPGSAIFGANAFVGVINIVTYTAEDLEGLRISGGGGSFHTQQYNLQFGRVWNDLNLSGFLQYADTDGPQLPVLEDFQTFIDQILAPFGIPAVSQAPGKTVDYATAVDANIQATYKGLTLNGRIKDELLGGFIGNVNILGDSEFDYRQIAFDIGYRHAIGEQGHLLGKVTFTQNEFREFFDLFPPGITLPRFDGSFITAPDGVLFEATTNFRRFGGELTLDYPIFQRHHLTLGVSFEQEGLYDQEAKANFDTLTLTPLPSFQTIPYTVIPDGTSRNIFGAFVQDIWTISPTLGLTLGTRYDRYNDFGETVNPRAGLVWQFARDFNLKLLYGSAFRAPSFFELFYTVPNILGGNPDLRPSTIQTIETAVAYNFQKKFRISINYYINAIQDFILPVGGFDPATLMISIPTTIRSHSNRRKVEAQGVELEVNARMTRNIAGFLNYAYQYPKDKETGKRLRDVPSHLANIGMTLDLGAHLSVTPTLIIRGSRPRSDKDPREDVAGYALLDVNLHAKRLWKTLEISATMNNVFNTTYVDPAEINSVPGDFPRPGRSIFIKAMYQF